MTPGFRCILFLGLVIQGLAFVFGLGDILSLICGTSGVLAVILCAERKIIQFLFAYIQLLTYFFICWRDSLWGNMLMNVWFCFTMAFGIREWKRNYTDGVVPRMMTLKEKTVGAVSIIICGFIIGKTLSGGDDPNPFVDSYLTVLSIVANLLMILRYREQWAVYVITNILGIILWTERGDWSVSGQYLFWIVNTLWALPRWYGWDFSKKSV